MSSSAPTRAQLRADARRDVPRRAPWRRIVWIALGVLALVLAVAAVVGGIAVSKALTVRDALTRAIPVASGLPAKIVAGDTEGATTDAAALQKSAAAAVAETEDGVWTAAEWIPFLGPNLAAIRTAAEGVDDLADFAVEAVPTLDLAAFRPADGAADLAAVHSLEKVVSSGAAVFSSVNQRIDETDRSVLLPQVTGALGTLDDAVSRVYDTLGTLAPILRVLPAALGE
ncbi:MAG: hypothetical protein E2584_05450, partial [Microbacterium sp.]|nr:hypothetical protein [Microbacterium sp.]